MPPRPDSNAKKGALPVKPIHLSALLDPQLSVSQAERRAYVLQLPALVFSNIRLHGVPCHRVQGSRADIR